MREKPVHFKITDCAQGTILGLSLLPNCPRLSQISLRGLLPRILLGRVVNWKNGMVATRSALRHHD
jgi:hypothetical protein